MHLADLTSYGLIRLSSRSAALARSPAFLFSASISRFAGGRLFSEPSNFRSDKPDDEAGPRLSLARFYRRECDSLIKFFGDLVVHHKLDACHGPKISTHVRVGQRLSTVQSLLKTLL